MSLNCAIYCFNTQTMIIFMNLIFSVLPFKQTQFGGMSVRVGKSDENQKKNIKIFCFKIKNTATSSDCNSF